MSGQLLARERIAYGAADFGVNLYFISVMSYLSFFYTDVFGLTPEDAALVVLVARWVDAVTDPMMGAIAERTRSRWGRMRPYLLFGAPLFGLTAVATFTAPELSYGGKLAWAYVSYTLFGLLYTVVTVPYASLTASLTSDSHERTVLSTVRMAFAFTGGLLVSVFMLPLVGLADSPEAGFRNSMAAFAVLATLLMWWTFAGTTERMEPPGEQRLGLMGSARAVLRNPPLAIVIGIFVLSMLAFTLRQSMGPYFFLYNVGRPDLIPWYFGITIGVMIPTLALVPPLSARFGKAGAVSVGAVVSLLGSVGLWLTPVDQILALFVFASIMAIGATPVAVLGWAMIPDTVDYAEWRSGVRADGSVFATASFCQKLGKMIAGAGLLAVLAAFGYVAGSEQSPATLEAIAMLISLGPGACMVLLIVFAVIYPLSAVRHGEIVDTLAERRLATR